jgi:hypothetical protein
MDEHRNSAVPRRAVELQFEELDHFIPHFAGTDKGNQLIAAFRAARNVIPRGKRSSTGSGSSGAGGTPPASTDSPGPGTS